jgi:hypothetical protein
MKCVPSVIFLSFTPDCGDHTGLRVWPSAARCEEWKRGGHFNVSSS